MQAGEVSESLAASNSSMILELSTEVSTPTSGKRKRRPRAKTPVVDDEVRRSSRIRGVPDSPLIHLENEPRKKKRE